MDFYWILLSVRTLISFWSFFGEGGRESRGEDCFPIHFRQHMSSGATLLIVNRMVGLN